ncbi:cilium assembly protein DZIP1 isoform X2 [Nelusetta ayraudi]|uniref:cilium assembly protein DZIP1 isoform X2 n=1 Tax=Nelusetta ayraudi TaxID=303726 RepID=UPI003F71342E
MPFHDGVYYPYVSDTQGTHSSAGIPSLLNSPLSQPSAPAAAAAAAAAAAMTPSSGASAVLPFKFRPRRESVDWRRISALDVDLVVSQLDVDTLQEHIGTVTFCSLDGERCQRCQSAVDPALMKLFRLAQLTVEWLLHCQEFLALSVRTAEERVAAAEREREQLLALQRKQEEKVKALSAELKQRKKVIRTQQSMLAPRLLSGHKCHQCDKTFINSTFLQNHMQRRHPEEYEIQMRSESEKKSEIESLKLEISGLKEHIVGQQQDLQAKTAQEKEQQSLHKDLLREIDRFKAEEMARMDRKIEDSRDGIRREMEFLYSRNIQALSEVNLNQIGKQEKSASPVQSQPERDLDNYKELHTHAIYKLEQQMKKQDKKWESRLQDIKAQHKSEKNELLNKLSNMQLSVSEQQEGGQRLQQEMRRQLQEKEQTIRAQREQLRSLSSSPAAKAVEVPVTVSAPAPEPKPKKVIVEEPACALKLEPIEELSEEERDSSSFSDKKPRERKPEPAPERKRVTSSVLKRNNSIKKAMRPDIEQAFVRKLEILGVKSDQDGLRSKELNSLLARVGSKRGGVAKGMPDYWRVREELARSLEQRLSSERRDGHLPAESLNRTRPPAQVLQIRPRSSSLPSRAPQVTSAPTVKQPKTPQPAPRSKTGTQPKTSTPIAKTAQRNLAARTPPFNSDEDSNEEDTDEEEEGEEPPKHQKPKPLQLKLNPPNPAQIINRPSRNTPVLARQAMVTQSASAANRQDRATVGRPANMAITNMESEEDDDWSDVSELLEIDPKRFQNSRDQNSNVDKRSFENKINELAKKMEKQFAGREGKRPAGGVSILPEQEDDMQDLTYTDLEESSDWVVSSLEDRQEAFKSAQGSGALKKSLDSPSTSVWGTSTGKGPKSGTGTGSTLRSSLCSVSDINDSDDQ